MLNLLRFRDRADYTAFPDLAPEGSITGAQAYALYFDHTLPYLEAVGGSVEFVGDGGKFLIGPLGEQWDRVMLVRHRSIGALMEMAASTGYQAGLGHRVAALEDSRLLPIVARAGGELR